MKTALELREGSGATARQIFYWTEAGYLKAHQEKVGSGRAYTYDDDELEVAERMARLTAGGVAANVAAEIARHPIYHNETAPGVYVLVVDIVQGQKITLSVHLEPAEVSGDE